MTNNGTTHPLLLPADWRRDPVAAGITLATATRALEAPASPVEGEEQKTIMYVFSPSTYDGAIAGAVGPTVGAVWGGTSGDFNSAVYACLKVICTSYMEAPLRGFRRTQDGDEDWLPDTHAFQKLVEDPHPSLTQPEVMFWLQYAKLCTGNSYLRKIRASAGNVVQLWPVSPRLLWPMTTEEDRRRGVFISFYRHDLGDGKTEDVPVDDIVHFRLGVDDRDHRLGLSNLARLVREISSDDEATVFTDALLKNFATPGLAVQIPAAASSITEEQARQIRDRLRNDYGGEGRGSIAVVANGATLQQIGFSPQQMELSGIHRVPEQRIAAVFGTAAMVVGLGAGLERSTFSNVEEAEAALFKRTILPLWRADAATYEKHLLRPDFTADRAVRVRFDTTDVQGLQEDMNQVYERLTKAVIAGWVTPDEARSEVGFPALPAGMGEAQPPAPEPPPQLPPPGEDETGQDQGQTQAQEQQRARTAALERKAQALGAIPGLLDTVADLVLPAVVRDLRVQQAGQYHRVAGRLRRRGA
jgi:HK97 family phage portal protein